MSRVCRTRALGSARGQASSPTLVRRPRVRDALARRPATRISRPRNQCAVFGPVSNDGCRITPAIGFARKQPGRCLNIINGQRMRREIRDPSNCRFSSAQLWAENRVQGEKGRRQNLSRIITFITSGQHRKATKTQLALALAQRGSVIGWARAQNAPRKFSGGVLAGDFGLGDAGVRASANLERWPVPFQSRMSFRRQRLSGEQPVAACARPGRSWQWYRC
jgi:hypothetical protein